jgi:hypothetical protein
MRRFSFHPPPLFFRPYLLFIIAYARDSNNGHSILLLIGFYLLPCKKNRPPIKLCIFNAFLHTRYIVDDLWCANVAIVTK